MNAHLAYWTFIAFVLLAGAFGCGAAGLAAIRRGQIERHRRLMTSGATLVVAFLLSYVVKLLVLGREDLDSWSTASLTVLRIHELLMLVMIVGGSVALVLGRSFRSLLRSATTLAQARASLPEKQRARHRWAGRIALGGALLGLLTAALVLLGMYARAGGV
jgi:uncharacterized membrane protein YozB (DUF420 family)